MTGFMGTEGFGCFIIRHIPSGEIESSSSRRRGIWASRSTALSRIKSYWHPKNIWVDIYKDPRPWDVKYKERELKLKEWREANPFDKWWPKHFEIIEVSEVSK